MQAPFHKAGALRQSRRPSTKQAPFHNTGALPQSRRPSTIQAPFHKAGALLRRPSTIQAPCPQNIFSEIFAEGTAQKQTKTKLESAEGPQRRSQWYNVDPKYPKWAPSESKVPQRDPTGAPKGHQGSPKAPQKTPRRPPEAPQRAPKWCLEPLRGPPKKRKARFARDSSESTEIEVERQYSHEKTPIQKVTFSEIFAEQRSRSSLALIWGGPPCRAAACKSTTWRLPARPLPHTPSLSRTQGPAITSNHAERVLSGILPAPPRLAPLSPKPPLLTSRSRTQGPSITSNHA